MRNLRTCLCESQYLLWPAPDNRMAVTTFWLAIIFFFQVSRKIILFYMYSSSNYSYRLEGMNKVVIVSESFFTAVMI